MILLLHTAATWALAGLIWTVQMVIYPLFSEIGTDAFRNYHVRYTKRIGFVVGPLMFAEVGTASLLFYMGERSPWFLASLVPLVLIWLSTWRLQIPLHLKLEQGFDKAAQENLVRGNWLRTASWSLRGICMLALAL